MPRLCRRVCLQAGSEHTANLLLHKHMPNNISYRLVSCSHLLCLRLRKRRQAVRVDRRLLRALVWHYSQPTAAAARRYSMCARQVCKKGSPGQARNRKHVTPAALLTTPGYAGAAQKLNKYKITGPAPRAWHYELFTCFAASRNPWRGLTLSRVCLFQTNTGNGVPCQVHTPRRVYSL